MRLSELLFTGMDVPSEAQKLMSKLTSIEHMTEDEKKAYEFGVYETLRAVRTILNLDDDHLVFHLEGHSCMEEFDLDALIEFAEEKEWR